MRFATSGATRWLIAPESARDTVEGCTPHFSAMSLMVGRDEAAGLAALPAPVLLLCTIGGIPVVCSRCRGFILRDASPCDAPQDEVRDPHGEERGDAARLEPCGHGCAAWQPCRRILDRPP